MTLAKLLDFEVKSSYNLVIITYDDIDHNMALNASAKVKVNVINVNEFSPTFINASGLTLKVTQGQLVTNLYQVCFLNNNNNNKCYHDYGYFIIFGIQTFYCCYCFYFYLGKEIYLKKNIFTDSSRPKTTRMILSPLPSCHLWNQIISI